MTALDRHAEQTQLCTYCPKLCRHSCPVSNATGVETHIPQAKMQLLDLLRRNALGFDEDAAMALFACTGCGLCTQYCEHENDVAEALRDGRAQAHTRGVIPPALRRLPEQARARADELHKRLRASPYADRLSREARVGFLPATDTLAGGDDELRDTITVFDTLKLEYVRIVDTPLLDAGYALWAAGFDDEARFAAEDTLKVVRRFSTVVVDSPAVAYMLRERLPRQGLLHNTQILHLSEMLALHADRLPVQRKRSAAYYHDPCYLGRHLGIYDAPRRLVSRCVDSLREFFHQRERAECCGGGANVLQTYPQAAEAQARKRVEEAALFGVSTVVTACPTCSHTLAKAGSQVDITSLAGLLAWALRPSDEIGSRR